MIFSVVFGCMCGYFAYDAYLKKEYAQAMLQCFFVGAQIGIIIGRSV